MKTRMNTLAKRPLFWLVLVLLIALLSLGGTALASRQAANEDVTAIEVLYKLDPRLSSAHLGDRWVSPPLYDIVSRGSTYTIEARVEAVAVDDGRDVTSANWSSSNPNTVKVSLSEDDTAALEVRGQGETVLELTAEGIYKVLYVSAAFQTSQCANLRVRVSQVSQPDMPVQTCRLMLPLVVNH